MNADLHLCARCKLELELVFTCMIRTGVHPYDTKANAVGRSVRACVERKSKAGPSPSGGKEGRAVNNKEDRQVIGAGTR